MEHHYVIGPIRFDPLLSKEASAVFRKRTTGDVGVHNYSHPHPEYNKAVQGLWDDWIKGKDKTKLTADDAEGFVRKVKRCRDPRIKDYLRDLHVRAKQLAQARQQALARLNSRLSKLRSAAAAGGAAAGVQALNAMANSPHYRDAVTAARAGNIAGVDNAVFELATDVAIEVGNEQVLPAIYGPWWWLRP